MDDFLPIQYSGFWDVPRIFLVKYLNEGLLFDCSFDENIDDYPSEYTVYLMPDFCEDNLQTAYDYFINNSPAIIGKIPVKEIEFDNTLRKFVNTKNFTKYLNLKG